MKTTVKTKHSDRKREKTKANERKKNRENERKRETAKSEID